MLGHLGEISVDEHRIGIQLDENPLKSTPFHEGSKLRQLERAKVENQLKAKKIDPALYEWASRVLFAEKKDGDLCFCVDY